MIDVANELLPHNSSKKHKNQIFSAGRGSIVLIFIFSEFANIGRIFSVEKPEGIFFLAKIQVTGPVEEEKEEEKLSLLCVTTSTTRSSSADEAIL